MVEIDKSVFTTPKWLTYALSWVVCLVAWALMASQTVGLNGPDVETYKACGDYGCGYSEFTQFQYLVAILVIVWLALTVMVLVLVFNLMPPPVWEFFGVLMFNVLEFAGFCAAATTCDQHVLDASTKVCSGARNTHASLVFAFFVWVGLCCLNYFTFVEWRDTRFEGIPDHVGDPLKDSFGVTPIGSYGSGKGDNVGGARYTSFVSPPTALSVPASTQTYA